MVPESSDAGESDASDAAASPRLRLISAADLAASRPSAKSPALLLAGVAPCARRYAHHGSLAAAGDRPASSLGFASAPAAAPTNPGRASAGHHYRSDPSRTHYPAHPPPPGWGAVSFAAPVPRSVYATGGSAVAHVSARHHRYTAAPPPSSSISATTLLSSINGNAFAPPQHHHYHSTDTAGDAVCGYLSEAHSIAATSDLYALTGVSASTITPPPSVAHSFSDDPMGSEPDVSSSDIDHGDQPKHTHGHTRIHIKQDDFASDSYSHEMSSDDVDRDMRRHSLPPLPATYTSAPPKKAHGSGALSMAFPMSAAMGKIAGHLQEVRGVPSPTTHTSSHQSDEYAAGHIYNPVAPAAEPPGPVEGTKASSPGNATSPPFIHDSSSFDHTFEDHSSGNDDDGTKVKLMFQQQQQRKDLMDASLDSRHASAALQKHFSDTNSHKSLPSLQSSLVTSTLLSPVVTHPSSLPHSRSSSPGSASRSESMSTSNLSFSSSSVSSSADAATTTLAPKAAAAAEPTSPSPSSSSTTSSAMLSSPLHSSAESSLFSSVASQQQHHRYHQTQHSADQQNQPTETQYSRLHHKRSSLLPSVGFSTRLKKDLQRESSDLVSDTYDDEYDDDDDGVSLHHTPAHRSSLASMKSRVTVAHPAVSLPTRARGDTAHDSTIRNIRETQEEADSSQLLFMVISMIATFTGLHTLPIVSSLPAGLYYIGGSYLSLPITLFLSLITGAIMSIYRRSMLSMYMSIHRHRLSRNVQRLFWTIVLVACMSSHSVLSYTFTLLHWVHDRVRSIGPTIVFSAMVWCWIVVWCVCVWVIGSVSWDMAGAMYSGLRRIVLGQFGIDRHDDGGDGDAHRDTKGGKGPSDDVGHVKRNGVNGSMKATAVSNLGKNKNLRHFRSWQHDVIPDGGDPIHSKFGMRGGDGASVDDVSDYAGDGDHVMANRFHRPKSMSSVTFAARSRDQGGVSNDYGMSAPGSMVSELPPGVICRREGSHLVDPPAVLMPRRPTSMASNGGGATTRGASASSTDPLVGHRKGATFGVVLSPVGR